MYRTDRDRTLIQFLDISYKILFIYYISLFLIIRMLKNISEYFTYHLIKLHPGTRLADSVEFFVYDTIKIFLLLTIIIFVISVIRSFFPPEKTKRILSHKKEFIGNILAALLGIVTPFCSCSAVPLFIGFVEAGVALGVGLSFLIAAPTLHEDASVPRVAA